MPTTQENLDSVAQGPKAVETDGLRVTQHSIGDLIKAQQHGVKQANQANKRLPLRVGKFTNSGPAF